MTTTKTFEERLAALEEAILGIQNETREAHSTMKALRDLRREVAEELSRSVREIVDEAIAAEVKKGLDSYSSTLDRAIEQAEAKVLRRFDELANILLTGRASGEGDPLPGLPRNLRDLKR